MQRLHGEIRDTISEIVRLVVRLLTLMAKLSARVGSEEVKKVGRLRVIDAGKKL